MLFSWNNKIIYQDCEKKKNQMYIINMETKLNNVLLMAVQGYHLFALIHITKQI